MSLSTIALAVLLVLWGITLLGIAAVSAAILGVVALITAILLLAGR